MKVLITGGGGFIGSHLVEHFQGRAEVRVLENWRTGHRHNLVGFEYDLMEGSIEERETVRRAMTGVDYVFHLAAMVSVPESMKDPLGCNQLNAAGTLMVLEEAARAHVKKLVFSSSAAIYGDNPATPKREAMLPEPKSPYAITKLDGEYYCQMFTAEKRLATACLRYFNVFGPRQDPKSAYAAAVPIFIDRAVRHEPITIYGDGQQTRDFVYVKDIVAANVFFATESPATGVFNVAGGKCITIKELCSRICELTGSHSVVQHAPERAGDVKHSLAAIDKLLASNFSPANDFASGLKATIEFFAGRNKTKC